MATYFGHCRQFGNNFGDCSLRERGGKCINCGSLVWILRQKPAEQEENKESNTENEEVSEISE